MMQRCIDATKEKDVITQQDPKYRQLIHHHFSQKTPQKILKFEIFFVYLQRNLAVQKKAF